MIRVARPANSRVVAIISAFKVLGFKQAYLCGEMKLGMFARLGNKTDGGFLISAIHPMCINKAEFAKARVVREVRASNRRERLICLITISRL